MEEFYRMKRLPPYVFGIVVELMIEARRRGEDIIDLGMGNPDLPTPPHIVDKLTEAVTNSRTHRYSASRGITNLRTAICNWYKRRYNVDLDPETEAVATIGVKEGLSHMALALITPGDLVLTQTPTYPIHPYSVIIANGDIRSIRVSVDRDYFEDLQKAYRDSWPRPKMMIISFPHNPTTTVVDRDFFVKIVDFAKEKDMMVIHDLAYADICFDGYRPPSFLEAPGAKDVGVEFYSMSKSYNMAGWRVGFAVGNRRMVRALTRIKSYLDYGIFTPIQVAAIHALNGPEDCVEDIRKTYRQRRDALCEGLSRIGWEIPKPKATMFVWAPIPEQFAHLGSLKFSELILKKARVAVSPGIGFGEFGDDFVRFALVENEMRIAQAVRGIRKMFYQHPK
jgi:alanine-synthesizing transaminase